MFFMSFRFGEMFKSKIMIFRSGVSSISSDSDCHLGTDNKKRTAKLERLVVMLRTAVDKLKEENKNLSLEHVVTNTDDKVSLPLFNFI